ncbi:MAG: ParA family protein [Deltaproteobacteria bacterium]|nr:ParA family protein [Deltaproteobacteria bacterium]
MASPSRAPQVGQSLGGVLGQRLWNAVGTLVQPVRPLQWDATNTVANRARVIAVSAQKGGVGKTTTAVHLAAGLAQHHGLHVLLVDLDAQGHVASSLRAHLRTGADTYVSQALLAHDPDLAGAATPTTLPRLHITLADKQLSNAEAQLATRMGRDLVLARALRTVRSRFDVIVIDCPPNLGLLTLNALYAADQLLVPCDLSVLALEGVDDLMRTLQTLQWTLGRCPQVLGLLHTRVDRRNHKQNSAMRRAIAQSYHGLSLRTEIGVNTALPGAQLQGKVVFEAQPESSGARDYRSLCDEVHLRLFADSQDSHVPPPLFKPLITLPSPRRTGAVAAPR